MAKVISLPIGYPLHINYKRGQVSVLLKAHLDSFCGLQCRAKLSLGEIPPVAETAKMLQKSSGKDAPFDAMTRL